MGNLLQGINWNLSIGQNFVNFSEHTKSEFGFNTIRSTPKIHKVTSTNHTNIVILDDKVESELEGKFLEEKGGSVKDVKKIMMNDITLALEESKGGKDI